MLSLGTEPRTIRHLFLVTLATAAVLHLATLPEVPERDPFGLYPSDPLLTGAVQGAQLYGAAYFLRGEAVIVQAHEYEGQGELHIRSIRDAASGSDVMRAWATGHIKLPDLGVSAV